MKSASSGLIAYLAANNEFFKADLYTFTLINGTVYRYTSAETDLTVGGNLYSSSGPKLTRTNIKTVIGMEVDTLKITASAGSGVTLSGVPFLQAAVQGLLDGATVKLDDLFMPTWGDTSLGVVNGFTGHVATITGGRLEMDIEVKSDLEYLNLMMPRNCYQSGCIHILYDGRCGLAKSSYAVSGTVSGSSTTTVIPTTLMQPGGWFSLGEMIFTSGVNNGVSKTIKLYISGYITLMAPLGVAPAPGDTFTAYAGCDKQQATCVTKFNNVLNFRGAPYIPVPETAY